VSRTRGLIPGESQIESDNGGAENHGGGNAESEESGRQRAGTESLESGREAQAHQDQPRSCPTKFTPPTMPKNPIFGPKGQSRMQPPAQEQLRVVHHGPPETL